MSALTRHQLPSWPREALPETVVRTRTAGMTMSLQRLPLHSAVTRQALRTQWEALAQRSAPGFFLSWAWIGTWLDSLPHHVDVHLLQATSAGHTVGLALLVQHGWRKVRGVPVVPAWYLHSTGDMALDSLYIEHNGFLVDPAWRGKAEPAMLSHWAHHTRGTRELWLPRLADDAWQARWCAALEKDSPRGWACDAQRLTAYAVDLHTVRRHSHDHLSTRSPTLRSQLRRSLKRYGEPGSVTLEAAASPAQALAFLDRLIALHQAHWISQGQPGAFATEGFVAFHRRLVQQQFADGRVQLLRLSAGNDDIGYLYGFVDQGRVLCYQSGFNYALGGPQSRPGYVAHLLAIEFNARLGHAVYDFMVGDERYKRDLANVEAQMHQVVLRTRSRRHRVETLVRRLLA